MYVVWFVRVSACVVVRLFVWACVYERSWFRVRVFVGARARVVDCLYACVLGYMCMFSSCAYDCLCVCSACACCVGIVRVLVCLCSSISSYLYAFGLFYMSLSLWVYVFSCIYMRDV